MKVRKEQTYIAPSMEVILIEAEQVMMGASTEKIGPTSDEIEWD